MDNKNVFIAVALSMSVLLFWSAFFDPPLPNENETKIVKNKQVESTELDSGLVPNIDELKVEQKISREDAIKKTNRVLLENNKIKGSISLEGAIINDLSFKNYRKNIDTQDSVIFFNQKD